MENKKLKYANRDVDTSSENTIICPYCGCERTLSLEDFEGRKEKIEWDDEEFVCKECGNHFLVNYSCDHYFTYKC